MPTRITNSEKVENITTTPEPDIFSAVKPPGMANKQTASLSSNVTKNLTDLPQMAPDWTNRRRMVFQSMYFCGGAVGLIVATVCVSMSYDTFNSQHGLVDASLIALAQSIIYAVGFFASTVIGSYCFGAAWESGAYRKNMTDMATHIATSAQHMADKNKKDKTKDE